MLEIKSQELIELCKISNKYYMKQRVLYIETKNITYKIYNVTEVSFKNLQKRVCD
ncbi:hypothetical protein [Cetobacterium sp.]|uniref:hypothetical protein n=1 Tax=Cetobacterium sp. TaxID=2071632 RepID=UPI003F412DEA